MQASTTLMVPPQHLARVGGLNQTLNGLAGIAVPPVAALATLALPMHSILLVDVATAVPAITALILVAIPQPARAEGKAAGSTLLADLREGLNFLLGWRALLYLSLVGLVVGMLGRAAAAMIPLMITQVFQQGVAQLSWWESAYGAGLIAGGLILGVWGGSRRRIATSMAALSLDGVVCLLIALTPRPLFPLTVAGMAALGILEAMVFGINGAIGQATVPPAMQGRVFSLVIGASQAAAPLGLLAAGPFADRFGVQAWWLLSASLITLTGAAALLNPSLMHIESVKAT
jgi:DHA3 family macrolide efflux protein-like MFS transporter